LLADRRGQFFTAADLIAAKHDFVARVLDGVLADISFIDPPYNVPIAGFVSGKGRN
jgi:hypothetical protein